MNEDKRRSILIVDDDQLVIQALTEILHPHYRIFVVRNGHEAVQKAKKLIPDVILLDIVMPEMDGYDVLTVLKSSDMTKEIPVIFITGLDDQESEEKALTLGAADYITKPLGSEIVKLRVLNQIKLLERLAIENDLHIVLKLQEELKFAKERAEHASRAKSEFLSRMSHEMLTPMNIITGISHLIIRQPEKALEHIDRIETASKSLLGMIHDVLDITDMEYGIFNLDETGFSVKKMIETAVEDNKQYLKAKKQKITSTVGQSIPDKLIGDEKRLLQVINCLFSNAIKFTPENGEIHLEAFMTGEETDTTTIQIEVTDNGEGIPKEQQKELFAIFEQVDGSNTREHGGIGLGLALSRCIVERMDGEIWVESEPGNGAKFTFTCKLKNP